LGLLTALLVPPLLVRIHAGEKLLHTQFGAEYDAYLPRPHVATDSRNLFSRSAHTIEKFNAE